MHQLEPFGTRTIHKYVVEFILILGWIRSSFFLYLAFYPSPTAPVLLSKMPCLDYPVLERIPLLLASMSSIEPSEQLFTPPPLPLCSFEVYLSSASALIFYIAVVCEEGLQPLVPTRTEFLVWWSYS